MWLQGFDLREQELVNVGVAKYLRHLDEIALVYFVPGLLKAFPNAALKTCERKFSELEREAFQGLLDLTIVRQERRVEALLSEVVEIFCDAFHLLPLCHVSKLFHKVLRSLL